MYILVYIYMIIYFSLSLYIYCNPFGNPASPSSEPYNSGDRIEGEEGEEEEEQQKEKHERKKRNMENRGSNVGVTMNS